MNRNERVGRRTPHSVSDDYANNENRVSAAFPPGMLTFIRSQLLFREQVHKYTVDAATRKHD